MPRGGKRKGAGRPKGSIKLTFMQKMVVGSRCERLLSEIMQREEKKKLKDAHKYVQELWDEAQSIPMAERGAWLNSAAYNQYQKDAKMALGMDQGIIKMPEDDNDDSYLYEKESDSGVSPERVVRFELSTPWGARKSVVNTVAVQTGLEPGYVDYCWKRFSEFERKTTGQ